MEPAASDAEPLRCEQPALIRSANRLFVAAHELGNLECRQQPIRQPSVARLRPRQRLECCSEYAPNPSTRSSSWRSSANLWRFRSCAQRRKKWDSIREPMSAAADGWTIGRASAGPARWTGGERDDVARASPVGARWRPIRLLLLWAPADHVRSDRLTRRFDAQEIVLSAPTSWTLERLLDARNRTQRPSKCFLPARRWRASLQWAVCRTAVTSAWSLAMLPRAALGRLGRFPIRLRPIPTVPAVTGAFGCGP